MAINYELLRKVKAHILEEPTRINMNDWIEKDEERLLQLLQDCGRDETYLPKAYARVVADRIDIFIESKGEC